MEPCAQHLSEDEIKRNTRGPLLVYEYSSQNLGKVILENLIFFLVNKHELLTIFVFQI